MHFFQNLCLFKKNADLFFIKSKIVVKPENEIKLNLMNII